MSWVSNRTKPHMMSSPRYMWAWKDTEPKKEGTCGQWSKRSCLLLLFTRACQIEAELYLEENDGAEEDVKDRHEEEQREARHQGTCRQQWLSMTLSCNLLTTHWPFDPYLPGTGNSCVWRTERWAWSIWRSLRFPWKPSRWCCGNSDSHTHSSARLCGHGSSLVSLTLGWQRWQSPAWGQDPDLSGVPEEFMKCWRSTVCTLAPIMNTNLWGRRSQPGWPVSSARSQGCEVSCWATPSWPVSPGLTAAHPEHKHKYFDIVWPETSSQDPKDYVSTSKGWISQSWERAATSWASYRAGGRALTTALLPERGASRRGRMSRQRPPACTLQGWSTHSLGAAGWSEICSKRLHAIEK